MEILYAILILVIAFFIWSNVSTKKLDKIGEIALKQYFNSQNEKYKVYAMCSCCNLSRCK